MDYQRILEALSRPSRELGVLPQFAGLRPKFTIQVHDCIPSTNKYAWNLVDQGAGSGTVVLAREQNAGQGQWGRTWISPPGGLYLSLVLEPHEAAKNANLLTLASAWGIVECLNDLGVNVQLKWPNDLIYEGHKVGGILTETRLSRTPNNDVNVDRTQDAANTATISVAVVGVGINWLNPTPNNAIALASILSGSAIERMQCVEELGAIVLRGIHQGYTYWQMNGSAALIAAYQTKLAYLGKVVRVNGHLGSVLGVSSDGNLKVGWNQQGQKSAHSFKPGEISLGYNT